VLHASKADAGKGSAPSIAIARVLSERTGIVIEARELTQRYGAKTAVDDLTFAVQPGIVTGFPGVTPASPVTR
jgi:ABC-type phosphonate transport system ATPase subunit